MDEKKKNLIVIIVGIIIIVGYFIIKGINSIKNEEDIPKQENKIILTTNYSMFFTVSNCANRYINTLVNKNSSNIIKLLDDEYITNNNINENNLNDYISNIQYENASIKVTKMYEKVISDNITNYYVKGKIIEEVMDEKATREDYYVIVTIDNNKNIFSITPYDGKIFEEEI